MLLDDMSDFLSTGGITADGTVIQKGYMDDTKDNVMALYETQGMAPVRAMSATAGAMKCEQPRLQIVTRAGRMDYATARMKMNDAYRLLDGMGDRTINGVRYLWVGAVSAPFMMGRDEQGRAKLVCNFDVVKELTTT